MSRLGAALGGLLLFGACAPAAGPSLVPSFVELGPTPAGLSSEARIEVESGEAPARFLDATLLEGDPEAWSLDADGAQAPAPGSAGSLVLSGVLPTAGRTDAVWRLRYEADGDTFALRLRARLHVGGSDEDGDGDGFSPFAGDCDDRDPAVHPGAPEDRCDGLDADCSPDPGEMDMDGDGVFPCAGDCRDQAAQIHPGAAERCEDTDFDCDGISGARDADGDGARGCDGDCDDADPRVGPEAPEVCDGLDNDCEGTVDIVDADGDGFGACREPLDCDDGSRRAHPVLLDASAPPGGDGSPSAPARSLAEAVAALDGVCNRVLALPGVYRTSTIPVADHLEVRALVLPPAPGTQLVERRLRPEIRPEPGAPAFRVTGGSLQLRSVQLLGGDSGALLVEQGGSAVLEECAVRGFRGARPAIEVDAGDLALYRSAVENNHNSDESGGGGGLDARGADVLSEDTLWAGNSAAGRGGAIRLQRRFGGADSSFRATRSRFEANLAGGDAGAVRLDRVAAYRIEDSVFVDNEAVGAGGAVQVVNGGAGRIRGSLFVGNRADLGGAIVLDEGLDLRSSVFIANHARAGGAADGGCAPGAVFANNTLVANTADEEGGAIRIGEQPFGDGCLEEGTAEVRANIVAGGGGASVLFSPSPVAAVSHNTVHASAGAAFSGKLVAGRDGNEVRDPRFVAWDPARPWEEWDLSLAPESKEIDAGPPGEAWLDPDGTRNDRGHTGGPEADP